MKHFRSTKPNISHHFD